jgi:predicted nucleotidyltransferase component of viral defense system
MTNPPVGLQPDDLQRVMDEFGVSEEQVRRDHAVSHILAALSRSHREQLIFYGGTALSRTFLLDGRLSEDIDLIALSNHDELADVLVKDIADALRRTHGRIVWDPRWTRQADAQPAMLVTPNGIAIRIQLLRETGYAPWPTELRQIEQRYRDALPAILRVPTLPAFAGWKTATWIDRYAARDLYDLWALSKVGALNPESAALFVRYGPTGRPPAGWMFDRAPSPEEWRARLGGQTKLTVSADEALFAVRAAWSKVVSPQP